MFERQAAGAGPSLGTLLRIWPYVRRYRGRVTLLFAGLTLESLYEVFFRYSFKLIVDDAITPGDYGYLTILLCLLGAAAALYAATSVAYDYLWAKYGLRVINDLRYDLFASLQFRAMGYFDKRRAGDLGARFTGDTARVEDGFLYALPMGAMGLLQIVLSLGLMAHMNVNLFLLSLTAIVMSLWLPRVINDLALAAGYAFRSQEGQLSAHVQENITAQPLIKAYGLERMAASGFRRELDQLLAFGVRSYFLSYLSQRVPHLLFALLHLVIFGVGATMVMDGTITLGDLVSFQALFFGLSQSMSNVAWLIPSMIDASASLHRIVEVIDEAPITSEKAGSKELPPLRESITFERVAYRHGVDGQGVGDLSFSLPQGSFTALVGPTGAGKTTTVNLLLRFIDPDSGAIRLDGADIREATLESLRRRIGLVSQDVILFRTSIRDNIRAGSIGATDAEIEAAAQSAGIHAFILGLPQGYETVYGKDGRQFSGGERQRIALARALVRRPEILILDEATSSLDTNTEAGILATIRAVRGQSTILAITHRLVMARHADRILVMRDGGLVEDGTHSELVAAGGLYAELWRDRGVGDS